MPPSISFFKYSATGNDFILIDNRTRQLHGDEEQLLRSMCERKTGIGADGVLLIEEPDHAECSFKMRYFNRDGREAEMCGNGARASSFHACHHNLAGSQMRFEVSGRFYHASVLGERVQLRVPKPFDLRLKPGVVLQGASAALEEGGYINTGVPHYVLFVEAVDRIEVEKIGRGLRHHPYFQPAGTNVNFVEIVDANQLRIRTYERGVEEETLACGTGAVASALIAHLIKQTAFPTVLSAPGGELRVMADDSFDAIALEGTVQLVFTGSCKVAL